MMGPRREAQAVLFYEFSLEGHVQQDHLLRPIDPFVDLSSILPALEGNVLGGTGIFAGLTYGQVREEI